VRGDSAESRIRVGRVWDAVRPTVLLHGHIHEPGGGVAADGRRVISLGRDGQPGNIAFLSLDTLAVDVPSLHDVRTL
jgi:Icc-related predicted phosphoesterase